MSEERQGGPVDPQVKVVDRRRFRSDGEPLLPAEPSDAGAEPRGEGTAGAAVPAADAAASAEDAPGASPDERDVRLAAQEARIDELMRAYAALIEDNKAFRQRQEREKARVIEAERADIAQSLLEAADDLERALAAVSTAEVRGRAMENLLEGVRLSLASLQKRIGALGAVRLRVEGQPFDPRLAEAIDTVPVADAELDGCVIQEIRPGYRIGDRVLRPSRVRVGRLARA